MPDSISKDKKYIITIAGPTASGKSGLAMALAGLYQAEIFSADSRQIYKEISIGTAKPSKKELSTVKHHFVDMLHITSPYTAGLFAKDLNNALEAYFMSHDIAIIVGGTGLYFKAFLNGFDDLPEVNPEINELINQKYNEEGIVYLRDQLKILDPEYYQKADIQNPHRMIRALGIGMTTGSPYSSYLSHSDSKMNLPFQTIGIVLDPERKVLYENINRRVDEMILAGLEEEARSMYPKRNLQALQTVGYQEFFDYFDGKLNREETIALIKQNSRRYAKRQVTWFKKYGLGDRFSNPDIGQICAYIHRFLGQGS